MKSNHTHSGCPNARPPVRCGAVAMLLAALLLAAVFAGHNKVVRGGTARYPKLPRVSVVLGNKTVKLWVAASPRTRDRGLMYIHKMPDDCGMLFVFPHSGRQTFWMKHTLIPLDLIFLNQQGVIVRHYFMPPDHGKKLYPSVQPIRYAIELNAGAFQRLHLHDFMHINLPKRYSIPARKAVGAS